MEYDKGMNTRTIGRGEVEGWMDEWIILCKEEWVRMNATVGGREEEGCLYFVKWYEWNALVDDDKHEKEDNDE